MPTIHIVGAGLSGLSCATHAATTGFNVIVYEAAGHAGGRARSFYDESLGCIIDNGNHLLLGANKTTRTYLAEIDAADSIREISPAVFPFLDFKSGKRWGIRPGKIFPPIWIFSSKRRIPHTRPMEYFSQIIRLRRAGEAETVADAVGTESLLFNTLWQPMSTAVLNTDATEASASLLWRVIKETFVRGEKASRPWYFPNGLGEALVRPAQDFLTAKGVHIRFSKRLREIRCSEHRVKSLIFSDDVIPLDRRDAVVLAVPPEACRRIFPVIKAPSDAKTIVNAHFRLENTPSLPGNGPFLGLINAETHWIFVRDNIVSLTVSAADAIADEPGHQIANRLWIEASAVLRYPLKCPPAWRIIKERRATFAQNPTQVNARPVTTTGVENLFLAGDWTDTGLPATIEGSILSGFRAAKLAGEKVKFAVYTDTK
tara:strand:- start:1707 stop:2993 length:1287 start_codon:yes stop_codon:yes gene_type:complete